MSVVNLLNMMIALLMQGIITAGRNPQWTAVAAIVMLAVVLVVILHKPRQVTAKASWRRMR